MGEMTNSIAFKKKLEVFEKKSHEFEQISKENDRLNKMMEALTIENETQKQTIQDQSDSLSKLQAQIDQLSQEK